MLYNLTIIVSILISPLTSSDFISIKITNKANLKKTRAAPIKWQINTLVTFKNYRKGVFDKVELHDGTQGWLSKILHQQKNLIVIKDANLLDSNGKTRAKVLKDNIIKSYKCNLRKHQWPTGKNVKGYIKNLFVGFLNLTNKIPN